MASSPYSVDPSKSVVQVCKTVADETRPPRPLSWKVSYRDNRVEVGSSIDRTGYTKFFLNTTYQK